MKEYPMTFEEFIKRFGTEEDCRAYLFSLRWANNFSCPKCSHNEYWTVNQILYTCKKCRHQTSVIAGTIFQDTHKTIRQWFIAIWWITTQKYGASAQGLQQVLGLGSYKTLWAWLHKIRVAMVNPHRVKLSGKVEVDETYIGGEENEGKRGRGTENKALVAVAVEINGKKPGRLRLSIIDDASKISLHKFISENVEVGSTIVSDDWSGYLGLEKIGYTREIYVQNKAKTDDEMLPHVHLIISLLKRWLLGTHQGAVSKKHLQSYLDEYVFRFNRRTASKRGLLFYRLVENAMKTPPKTFDEITEKPYVL